MQDYDFGECICEIRDRLSKTRKIRATYDGIEGEITSLRGLREIADIAISVAQNIC